MADKIKKAGRHVSQNEGLIFEKSAPGKRGMELPPLDVPAVTAEAALGSERYRAPEVISRNMQEGRIGLRSGAGFLDYSGLDIDAYREQRLASMVDMLRHFGLARPPVV